MRSKWKSACATSYLRLRSLCTSNILDKEVRTMIQNKTTSDHLSSDESSLTLDAAR